jgi:hypothetical protein
MLLSSNDLLATDSSELQHVILLICILHLCLTDELAPKYCDESRSDGGHGNSRVYPKWYIGARSNCPAGPAFVSREVPVGREGG